MGTGDRIPDICPLIRVNSGKLTVSFDELFPKKWVFFGFDNLGKIFSHIQFGHQGIVAKFLKKLFSRVLVGIGSYEEILTKLLTQRKSRLESDCRFRKDSAADDDCVDFTIFAKQRSCLADHPVLRVNYMPSFSNFRSCLGIVFLILNT